MLTVGSVDFFSEHLYQLTVTDLLSPQRYDKLFLKCVMDQTFQNKLIVFIVCAQIVCFFVFWGGGKK